MTGFNGWFILALLHDITPLHDMTHYLTNGNKDASFTIHPKKADSVWMEITFAGQVCSPRDIGCIYMRMTKAKARAHYASLVSKGWKKGRAHDDMDAFIKRVNAHISLYA